MAIHEPTLAALVEEVAQLRAAVTAQSDVIAQQQIALAALRREAHAASHGDATASHEIRADETPLDEPHAQRNARRMKTSRRGLIRGAAAATAAAAVATVAVGAAEQAHAAPLANGDSFLLGESNAATSTTALAATVPSGTAVGLQIISNAFYPIYASTSESDSSGFAAIHGVANTGVGLLGSSGSFLDLWAGGTGRILQQPRDAAGAPTGGTYSAGESIRDLNGDLWLCIAGNNTTLGTWVKVAHLAPGATAGGAITYLSAPIRLLDTRKGASAKNTPEAPFAAGSTNTIQVAGVSYNTVTVPASCAGAIGNLTVIGAVGDGGYAALVPSGAGFTGTANLAFNAGQVVSNAYNVGLSSGGALDIILGPAASADVILDLFAIVS